MVIDFNLPVENLDPGLFGGKLPSKEAMSKYADDYSEWEKTKEGQAPVMPQKGTFTPVELAVSILNKIIRDAQGYSKTSHLRHIIRLSNDINSQLKDGVTEIILPQPDVQYLRSLFAKYDFKTKYTNQQTQQEEPIHDDNIKFILLVEDALINAKNK